MRSFGLDCKLSTESCSRRCDIEVSRHLEICRKHVTHDCLSLLRSEDEHEMCVRTVYYTNIYKRVSQTDLKGFFEMFCKEVQRLRLGYYRHQTRIAFVEFAMAESGITALHCSGMLLGALPIRVSPSKTPIRLQISINLDGGEIQEMIQKWNTLDDHDVKTIQQKSSPLFPYELQEVVFATLRAFVSI